MATPLDVLVRETLPQTDDAHRTPFCISVQFTPWLESVLASVAVNFCVPFTGTFAVVGETATDCTVIVTEADWLVSAAEKAVSVTVMGEPGAV